MKKGVRKKIYKKVRNGEIFMINITVQDLFRNCDPLKLADYFILKFFEKEHIIEQYKQNHDTSSLTEEDLLAYGMDELKKKIRNCITEVCNLEQIWKEEPSIIGIVPYYDELSEETSLENPASYDTFVFDETELKQFDPEQFPVCKTLEDIKKTILPITIYNFMLEDWKAVVTYKIPHFLIRAYGQIEVAANILYEMTWCGFDYETSRVNANSIGKDGTDTQEEIEEEEEVDLTFLNELKQKEPYVYSEYEKAAMVKNRNETRYFFVKMKEHMSELP